MAPTVAVAGLLKPPIASCGLISPDRSMAAIRIMAVRSTGSFSVAKRITAETTRPSTRIISSVMVCSLSWLGGYHVQLHLRVGVT